MRILFLVLSILCACASPQSALPEPLPSNNLVSPKPRPWLREDFKCEEIRGTDMECDLSSGSQDRSIPMLTADWKFEQGLYSEALDLYVRTVDGQYGDTGCVRHDAYAMMGTIHRLCGNYSQAYQQLVIYIRLARCGAEVEMFCSVVDELWSLRPKIGADVIDEFFRRSNLHEACPDRDRQRAAQ